MSEKQTIIFLKCFESGKRTIGKQWETKRLALVFAQSLIKEGIALPNNEKNQKVIKELILKEKREKEAIEREKEKIFEKINGKELLFVLKKIGKTIFGTVSRADIIKRLSGDFLVNIKEKNFTDFLSTNKEEDGRKIEIKLSDQIRAKLNLRVITQETK